MGIASETGHLRQVIVHRPGNELARVTPSTMDSLLYDDVPWVEKAQSEHDGFADVLRGEGAEVLYLEELLAQALTNPDAREYAIETTFDPRSLRRRGSWCTRGLCLDFDYRSAGGAADLRAH